MIRVYCFEYKRKRMNNEYGINSCMHSFHCTAVRHVVMDGSSRDRPVRSTYGKIHLKLFVDVPSDTSTTRFQYWPPRKHIASTCTDRYRTQQPT